MLEQNRFNKTLEVMVEYGLYAFAFFIPFSVNITNYLIAIVFFAWLAKLFYCRKFSFVHTSLDLPIALFLSVCLISVFNSVNKNVSALIFYYTFFKYAFVFFVITNNLKTREQVYRLMVVLLISGVIVTFYGFYQYIVDVDTSKYDWVDASLFPGIKTRVFASLGNPNAFGGYLVAIILLGTGILLNSENLKTRLTIGFILVLMSICLVLTYSRGAWLSLMGAIVIIGIFRNRRVFAMFLTFVVLILVFSPSLFFERLLSTISLGDSSSALRVVFWQGAIEMIQDYPLFGVGVGAFHLVYPNYVSAAQNGGQLVLHAHNMFLQIAAETGIIGLIIYLSILFIFVWRAVVIYRLNRDRCIQELNLGLLASFSGFILHGFADYVMFSMKVSLLFWVVMALMMVLETLVKDNASRVGKPWVQQNF